MEFNYSLEAISLVLDRLQNEEAIYCRVSPEANDNGVDIPYHLDTVKFWSMAFEGLLFYFRVNVVPFLAAVWALLVLWKTVGRNGSNATTTATTASTKEATGSSGGRGPAYSLPVGPPKWPILGNVPAMVMAGSSSKYLRTLVGQFGPVFTLYMGTRPVVVLNTYEAIKRPLLDGHLLSERCPLPALEDYFKGRGIVAAHYPTDFKKTRNFALNCLRHFGVMRGSFESVVATEADRLIDYIKAKHSDGPYDPLVTLQASVCDVICGVVYGKQFDYEDQRFLHLLSILHTSLREIQYAAASSLVPGVHYLPGCNYRKFYASMDTLVAFSQEEVDEHEASLDPDHPRDIIDLYLAELLRHSPDDSDFELFNKTNIAFIATDFFMAGTETSSTALYWALLLAASNPLIQEKVWTEIDDVTSQSDHVTISDGAKIPYTKAFIEETIRFASVAVAAMRSTTSDTVIEGHRLEAGTWVMLNYEYASFDPDTWAEPEAFKPERFIDGSGQFKPDPRLVSFGLGKRNCLGEKLARLEIFLFFTNIIKNFELVFPDNTTAPSTDPRPGGMTRIPNNYEVCFKRRAPSLPISRELGIVSN